MSLEKLNAHLVRVFRAVEFALEEEPSSIETLELELEALEAEESEGLLGCLSLNARRAQVANRLVILYQMQLVLHKEERNNSGVLCIAREQTRLRTSVEDPKSFLRLACLGSKAGLKNKKLASEKRAVICRTSRTTEQTCFKALQQALNRKAFKMARVAGEYWGAAEALVRGSGDLDSDEGTELLSDTSALVLEDLEKTFGFHEEEEEDDQGPGRPSALKRQKVSNNEEEEGKGEEKEQKDEIKD